MDETRARRLRQEIELGERVDAIVARFGRLQDTLGDKLLPELPTWLAEPVGPAIDNLARAELLGWISDGEAWIESRQLRNRMIHEYVRDRSVLAAALNKAHEAVPMLVAAAQRMAAVTVEPASTPDQRGAAA